MHPDSHNSTSLDFIDTFAILSRILIFMILKMALADFIVIKAMISSRARDRHDVLIIVFASFPC